MQPFGDNNTLVKSTHIRVLLSPKLHCVPYNMSHYKSPKVLLAIRQVGHLG